MFKDLFQIPKERVLTYTLLLGAFPLIVVLLLIYSANKQVDGLHQEISSLTEQALLQEKVQATNKAVIENYTDADRFYIDKNIETIQLLKPEMAALEKITRQDTVVENEKVRARLNDLKLKNKLQFSEGVVQSYPNFTETIETLVNPVEVDQDDIQNILSKIEGIRLGPYAPPAQAPQLIITDFKIEKKEVSSENEVFLLNMKLIKREYSKDQ